MDLVAIFLSPPEGRHSGDYVWKVGEADKFAFDRCEPLLLRDFLGVAMSVHFRVLSYFTSSGFWNSFMFNALTFIDSGECRFVLQRKQGSRRRKCVFMTFWNVKKKFVWLSVFLLLFILLWHPGRVKEHSSHFSWYISGWRCLNKSKMQVGF